MYVSSFPYGFRVDLWPFNRSNWKWLALSMILSKGWVPERSSRTDPLKENRREFFPISPIVSIFRLYPRRLVLLSIRDLRSSGIYKENELKVANLCKHSRLSHRQKFHLNSALPKQLKIAQVTHTRGG